ncbi:Ureidoglycolate lyase [Loxospora ochrophaea]|nr:Ureidoglycolate lyase [Loxospora ochrophaea]
MTLCIEILPARSSVQPLSQAAFKPFGYVIETQSIRTSEQEWQTVTTDSQAVMANQGTALKHRNVSPLVSKYDTAPTQFRAEPVMSMFVCLPQKLNPVYHKKDQEAVVGSDKNNLVGLFDLKIMERHPYTTQTFVPFGLHAQDSCTRYLVVVAPTSYSTEKKAEVPDTGGIRAYIAHGSQAVTYEVGTWHAPMIVIGRQPINFIVTQFTNNVAEDDCEEVELTPLGDKGIQIQII